MTLEALSPTSYPCQLPTYFWKSQRHVPCGIVNTSSYYHLVLTTSLLSYSNIFSEITFQNFRASETSLCVCC